MNTYKEITDKKKMFATAFQFAERMHKGQKRNDGTAFFSHPVAVAKALSPNLELMTVGILHDTIEDTEATYHDLFELGLPFHIVKAVQSITRREDQSYDEYIDEVRKNWISCIVKIFDIQHNIETLEGSGLSEENKEKRRKKYLNAQNKLSYFMSYFYEKK